ncbi:hypothetical protein DAPPUDRAFT_320808 [Daphnia pulex]|uniref:Uncharacterized protein n=1 Tax=Daphnia pulex TaxID=6669 RepID=E9GR49_DAPPU|nr:hypothetical protein DAPPUDRAFT_320808 [Daphnia pulex]|eukprot:EFX78054.1 hypothetical protein DAPPUDRAFT_320808 [Daphnia pulex]
MAAAAIKKMNILANVMAFKDRVGEDASKIFNRFYSSQLNGVASTINDVDYSSMGLTIFVLLDGGGGVAVGDDNAVAGRSGDGDDVEAIRARSESRPKRAVKCREILDPSHVSKRRKVHKAPEKQKSPSPCRE